MEDCRAPGVTGKFRDVVVPEVRAGRERAGKSLDGFEIAAAVPAAMTGDARGAYDSIRAELLTYFALPFYRTMIERSAMRPGAQSSL